MNVRHLRPARQARHKQRWPRLAAPVNAYDNTIIARAMSLTGRRVTLEEARVIVAEADATGPQPMSWLERTIKRIKAWLVDSSPDKRSSV